MTDDTTTVSTQTTTVVDPSPANTESHDGILPEPDRKSGVPLWYILIGTLCVVILAMAGTFVYLAVNAEIDSAALVGLFGLVLAATMDLYRQRKG